MDLTVPRDYYESLPEAERALLRCNVVDQLEERAEKYLDSKF